MAKKDTFQAFDDVARGLEEDSLSKNRPLMALVTLSSSDASATPPFHEANVQCLGKIDHFEIFHSSTRFTQENATEAERKDAHWTTLCRQEGSRGHGLKF